MAYYLFLSFFYMDTVDSRTYTRVFSDASRSSRLGKDSLSRPRRSNVFIIPDQTSPLADRCFPGRLTRSGRAVKGGTRISYLVTELKSNRVTLSIQSSNLTARDIFFNPRILPYTIDFREFSDVQSRFQPELSIVRLRYSNLYPRVPELFRITDFSYMDDLGRFYVSNPKSPTFKLEWFPYSFSLSHSFRDNIRLPGGSDGFTIARPVYMFAGCAGYPSYYQEQYLFSLRYDFHHVEENRLDVRPDSIVPIPTAFHRYIHSKDLSEKKRNFFKIFKPLK